MKLKLIGKILNPSCSELKIVPCLCLLRNRVNVSFIHIHRVHCPYLAYVRHFLNHVVIFFGPFLRPLWPSALGSRLVCLMVARPWLQLCIQV